MIVRLATNAMGTRFEFVLCGDSEAFLRSVGEAAIEEVLHWHRQLSPHAPDSLVSHLHREGSVRVDSDVWDLMSLCDLVWRESQGTFDPSYGSAGTCRGWGAGVALDASQRTIRLAQGVTLDFGAVAKGFALEKAASIVREHKVQTALLHGGTSSVIAMGAPPDEPGWRVRVRSDGEPRVQTLRDRAMSVSAPRGRVVDGQGHIVDPRTGVAARHVDTAVVVGPDAAVAEAWSTAVVVLGERPAGLAADYDVMVHTGCGWMCDTGAAGMSFREVA